MVRLSELPEWERDYLLGIPCPTFDTDPWVAGPPLSQRRVAMISTAGLQRRGDRPFMEGTADFRVIPGNVATGDMVMSHISVNFRPHRFPAGPERRFSPRPGLTSWPTTGSSAPSPDFHYSFMGATDPREMEPTVRHLAGLLKDDAVDAVLLVPV